MCEMMSLVVDVLFWLGRDSVEGLNSKLFYVSEYVRE